MPSFEIDVIFVKHLLNHIGLIYQIEPLLTFSKVKTVDADILCKNVWQR